MHWQILFQECKNARNAKEKGTLRHENSKERKNNVVYFHQVDPKRIKKNVC